MTSTPTPRVPTRTVVHLMRHGEVHNPTGVLYGRLDGYHLSDLGREMAELVTRHLATNDIVLVVASPLDRAQQIPGLQVYGPRPGVPRSPLMAFNVRGLNPRAVATALDSRGIEARGGCHCASLAHHELGLTPQGSCRLSFAAYTSLDDVDRALDALDRVVR